MFSWLVARINDSIKVGTSQSHLYEPSSVKPSIAECSPGWWLESNDSIKVGTSQSHLYEPSSVKPSIAGCSPGWWLESMTVLR